MEDLVIQNIDGIMKSQNVPCKCEHCKFDTIALALNFLPPRYIVTAKGETYAKIQMLDQQFKADIFAAVTKATVIISNNPRHGKDESQN